MGEQGDNNPQGPDLADLRRMRAFPNEYSDDDRRRVHQKARRGWWVPLAFFLFGVIIGARWYYWVVVLVGVAAQVYLLFLANDVVRGVPPPGGTRQESVTERAVHEVSVSEELARLVEMHEAGHLTQAEFEAAKAKLLGER